jgi:hypothetical protein
MAMVPHERSLVKRLEGKPFTLLGVNADESKEKMKKSEERNQITWRSWFDGRGADGSGGPIAKEWHIKAFPSIYVLDAKGVIRYKGVRGKDMDNAVDTLLKEMETTK